MSKYDKSKPIPVLLSAEKLCVHTLKVTQNLNNFPKKYRFTLVDKLISCSLSIYDCIEDANSNRGEDRIYYQTQAITYCRKMRFYLKIVYEVLHPECSIPYWNGIVKEIEDQLKNWKSTTKK